MNTVPDGAVAVTLSLAANAGGWLPAQTDVMSWCPVNGTGSS